MSRLVRTLLIWLLVLALPAQGAAVAAMIGCGPRHAATAPAGAEQAVHGHAQGHSHSHTGPQAADHPHHPAADGAAVGHSADASTDASASTGQAPHSATAGHAASADAHKCSVCASCCSAGAILNTVPSVPTPEIAPVVFAPLVASVAPFAVPGPDRPPRGALA